MKLALILALSVGGYAGVERPQKPAPVRAQGVDQWFGADKVKHFLASAFVQSVSYSALRATGAGVQSSLIGATAVTGTVGLGKELTDARRGGTLSVRDLVWNAAGVGAASVLLVRTSR